VPLAWCGALAGFTAAAEPALQSFSLPWNDGSTTITSLGGWTPAPAAAKGWVTVDSAGHLSYGGQRLRILGVNCAAGAAFPDKATADIIALRLRKFGINGVRLHHLDAGWMAGAAESCLVSYTADAWGLAAKADPTKLRAKALDRLQYFVSRLRARGIFVDLNLLTGREYFASDGLPAAVESMIWEDQHVLGFFDAKALELQKQYAKLLLTAPDPYAGVPLGRNPAVAFVEINNEIGMLQRWMDGALDALPPVFQQELAAKWNSWLRKRYASTTALETAWGAESVPLGATLLANGNFARGTTGWAVEQHAPAVRTYAVTKDFTGGKPSMKITISTAGLDWHVQMNQGGLSLTKGRPYTVSFWARASGATPLSASVSYAGPTNYDPVYQLVNTTLGTTWRQYQISFYAPVTASNLRLNFGGFGATKGSLWFADVKFQPDGSIGKLPGGVSLEKGNIPSVSHAAGSTIGQRQDWVRFLVATEETYWKTMRDHVKSTLGYPGLVFGSIVATSSPNVQAAFDVVDTHGYWAYPQYPNGWSQTDWSVANASMVNTSDNPLVALAMQRVKGKPHFVTEYQHASPNSFGGEGPVFLGAVAGLQDWDGIWMFCFGQNSDDWDRGYVTDWLSMDTHPAKMANLLLTAAMFRRGDVAAAKSVYTLQLRPDAEIEAIAAKGKAWGVVDGATLGYPARLALQKRFSLAVGANAIASTKLPAAPTAKQLVSDTGELTWDTSVVNKGLVKIDTARTKAVVGFANKRTFTFGQGLAMKPGTTRNDWCTAGLMLTGGASLLDPAGSKGLLIVTGDVANTGQQWTDAAKTSVGANWGRAPTLVEVVPLTVTLPAKSTGVNVWALTNKGARKTAVAVKALADGRSQFTTGASGATLWYEVNVAKGAALKAPAITTQPKSGAVAKGAKVTLAVKASGSGTLTYQWYKDGKPIAKATSASYAIASFSSAAVGKYAVKVTNVVGSASSPAAALSLK
jgi:hypothetical protein